MISKATYRALKRLRTFSDLQAFLKAQKPPVKASKKTYAARKSAKAARHRDETARIREAVFKRADGVCEGCGWHLKWSDGWSSPDWLEMDHWLGGNGRRRQKQSIETCWMLCSTCHRNRTNHQPTASYWNEKFRRHCVHFGYPFTPHIEHAPVVKPGIAPPGARKAENV